MNVNGKGSRWERGWTDVKEEEEECVFNTIISLAAIAALVLPGGILMAFPLPEAIIKVNKPERRANSLWMDREPRCSGLQNDTRGFDVFEPL